MVQKIYTYKNDGKRPLGRFPVPVLPSLLDMVFVSDKEDFPDAENEVINLDENTAYFITTHVDLDGCRLEIANNSVLFGTSSRRVILYRIRY
jgi:hypothetical protein